MSCILSSWQSSTWKLQTCGNNLKFTPFFFSSHLEISSLSYHKQCLHYNCIWAHFIFFFSMCTPGQERDHEHSDTSWCSKGSPGIYILVHAIFVNTNLEELLIVTIKYSNVHISGLYQDAVILKECQKLPVYIQLIVHRLLTQSRLSFTKTQNYDQRLASIILFNSFNSQFTSFLNFCYHKKCLARHFKPHLNHKCTNCKWINRENNKIIKLKILSYSHHLLACD